MSKNSKTTMDVSEDYAFMKLKNEQLIKEIVGMKYTQTKLISDKDYLMREMFFLEQKCKQRDIVLSEISIGSKQCLNKVVEISSELARIFELSKKMESRDNDNETTGTPPVKQVTNRKSKTRNQTLESKENADENDEDPNNRTFMSRGGKSLSEYSDLAIPESDLEIEEDNRNMEYNASFQDYLPGIPEDTEDSSDDHEEAGPSSSLPDNNSTSFFAQLPKTNVNIRRGEHYTINGGNDSSINVEVNSSLENSELNDSTAQNYTQENITITPKKIPQACDESSLRTTPRRTSFIKRKSIGSPLPQLIKLGGSKRRKSGSPISSFSSENRKSGTMKLFTSTMRKSLETSDEFRTTKRSGGKQMTSYRSSLFPEERDSGSVEQRKSCDADTSLGCQPIEELAVDKDGFILTGSKEVAGSNLEKTILPGNDSLYTSTPIPLQNDTSGTVKLKHINKRVCTRRKEYPKHKFDEFTIKQSALADVENNLNDSSVEREVSEEPTMKEERFVQSQIKKKTESTQGKKIPSRDRVAVKRSYVPESSLNESKENYRKTTNEKSDAQSSSSRTNDENNSSVAANHTGDFSDSSIAKKRKRKRRNGPIYKYGPESSYMEAITGTQSVEEGNESSHSPKNRGRLQRSCTTTSYNPLNVYEKALQRSAEKKRSNKCKQVECDDSRLGNDKPQTSSNKRESENEERVERHDRPDYRENSDRESFSSGDSEISNKVYKRVRAPASKLKDGTVQNEKRCTVRKMRARKEVEYKEPSLHVAWRNADPTLRKRLRIRKLRRN